MKLAFCLFRYFPYSGLSRVFLSIISEMAARGHQIDAYLYDWQGDYPDNVSINLLPSTQWTNHNRDAAYYKTVRPFLIEGNYDAVIGFNKMPGLDFYFAGDFCYADRISTKYSEIYRLTPRHHHFARFEKEVFGVEANTVLLMLSEQEKEIYQKNYGAPEDRFEILPPALDKKNVISQNVDQKRDAKREQLNLADDDYLILFVGSGFKIKGLDRAIIALSQLPAELKSKSRLLVVGQDNPQIYEKLASQLNMTTRVEFTGGRSDVPELMLAADCLLHPAYREAAGNVLLEAIASGLPVLTTDCCGYAPHVEKAKAGMVLTSPFSQKDITDGLIELLQSSDRQQLSDNGRRYGQRDILYTMPTFTADVIESRIPEIVNQKAQDKNRYFQQKTSSHYLTYLSSYQSHQLSELFLDPDAYLEKHVKQTMKHDQTTTVAVIECDKQLLVLKRYNTKSAWHFFKRSVRMTRACICWNFAHKLLKSGLLTPKPVGYLENRLGHFRGRSYYLAEFSTGVTLDEFLKGPFDEQKMKLSVQLIKHFFAVMSVQGLAHGDMKASNFLIKDRQLEVLDLDSMREYQFNRFHQHKLFRDKSRFLRNWNNQPEVYQYFVDHLFDKSELARLVQPDEK